MRHKSIALDQRMESYRCRSEIRCGVREVNKYSEYFLVCLPSTISDTRAVNLS